MFCTRWQKLPFDIIFDNLANLTYDESLQQEFTLIHRSNILSILQETVPTALVDKKSNGNEIICSVNKENIEQWVALFRTYWTSLEMRLLKRDGSKLNIVKVTPTESSMGSVVDAIVVLYALRKIAKHLFSLGILCPIFDLARTFLLSLYCLSLKTIQKAT